jgi:uncharacterized protein (TIGR02147 family)
MIDYRDLLETQYERRSKADPRYSRRAFARDLELSPSQLSEVMKGVHGLSPAKAADIAERLQFPRDQAELFLDLVECQHARDARRRESARLRIERRHAEAGFQTIAIDAFQMIAEWYHLAILELAKTKAFRGDAAWIARALSVPVESVWGAIRRLRRLGLVQVENDEVQVAKSNVATPDDVPSQAIRSFHAQVLAKAKDALATQPVAEREFGALILPFCSDRVADAKRMLREFQERFCEEFKDVEAKDEVYALGVQFFRLSDTRVADATRH